MLNILKKESIVESQCGFHLNKHLDLAIEN